MPIPEVSKVLEPRILSLVVSDHKTRRLTERQNDKFEEILRTVSIPCQYFCRSFATWDVLLPMEEQAAKIARSCISTKFFQFQPEYMGTQRIRVQVCNVPAYLTGDILAASLSANGSVEEISQLRATVGTVHRDYAFRVCLNREGFKAIPNTIITRDGQMMVVVEADGFTAGIASRLPTFQESVLIKIQQPQHLTPPRKNHRRK